MTTHDSEAGTGGGRGEGHLPEKQSTTAAESRARGSHRPGFNSHSAACLSRDLEQLTSLSWASGYSSVDENLPVSPP